MLTNPLRQDPSRTLTLRKTAVADVKRRYRVLDKQINSLVTSSFMSGLMWRYYPTDEKVERFRSWFDERVTGHGWSETYIRSAYEKGITRAYNEVRKASLTQSLSSIEGWQFYRGQHSQFTKQVMSWGGVDRLVALTYNSLQAVSESLAAALSLIIQRETYNPAKPITKYDLAAAMSYSVSSHSHRAQTVMRTEIVRAHAEGQLAAMEALNVARVGVQAEVLTSSDGKACPKCNSGPKVLSISSARGIIPHHPNCRCAWAVRG